MRVAAIDIGTNTFLCLIAEGDSSGIQKIISDESIVVRLGQEIDASGSFHPDALTRADACLKGFSESIRRHGPVDKVLAVATSAARDAGNAEALRAITERYSIPLSVASGDKEAQYSYLGTGPSSDARRLVIDIGGGSTEFIVGHGSEIRFAKSLDIGGVRMTERFVSRQPVLAEDDEKMTAHIVRELEKVLPDLRKHSISEIVAVAGTPTALAAIEIGGFVEEKVDGFKFSLERLEHWRKEFAATSVEEKKSKYGLGGRADIIFAGLSILCVAVKSLGFSGVTVSTKGLRYGVALDLLTRA